MKDVAGKLGPCRCSWTRYVAIVLFLRGVLIRRRLGIYPGTVKYDGGNQSAREATHCSSANVVSLIWWYRKLADLSASVTLASLENGKLLFGSA